MPRDGAHVFVHVRLGTVPGRAEADLGEIVRTDLERIQTRVAVDCLSEAVNIPPDVPLCALL